MHVGVKLGVDFGGAHGEMGNRMGENQQRIRHQPPAHLIPYGIKIIMVMVAMISIFRYKMISN